MRRFVLPGLLGAAAVIALFACGANTSGTALGLGGTGGDDTTGNGNGPSGTGTGSSAHTGSGGASTGTAMSTSGTNSGGASSGTNSGGASSGTNSGGASSGTNSGGASSSTTSSTTGATTSTGAGGGSPNCPPEGTLVYVLDVDSNLYSFDPPTLTFTKVGTLNCNSFFSPYSMAVSHDGTAYTVFEDGSLFKFDTKTADCTSTSFVPGQHNFTTFGMGFSANTPGSIDETLYVSQSDVPTLGLASIDLQTFVLTPIGMYNQGVTARAELTGTGDAKLFGAFEGQPYNVDQINKTNANILSQAPQNAIMYPPDSSNFAFAYWGGDFWLFVGPGGSTDVFHYQPANQTTTKVSTVQFEIVGAGVSICAPLHM